jgi:peptide/nickel transport system permease protein
MNRLQHKQLWLWLTALYLAFWLLIAPVLATHNPRIATAGEELTSPSQAHLLGTDRLGRDFWSRLVLGGQLTLQTALLATGISIGGGLILAICNVIPLLRTPTGILTDALLAFPGLLLALIVRTLIAGDWLGLAIAVGLANVAPYARIATGALQAAASAPYLVGAVSIGARPWYILLKHQLPYALPTLSAFGAVMFAWAILYASALSFLGLGESPSVPEWGILLAQGRGVLVQAPHLVLLPGALIALTIWIAYRVAEALTAPSK